LKNRSAGKRRKQQGPERLEGGRYAVRVVIKEEFWELARSEVENYPHFDKPETYLGFLLNAVCALEKKRRDASDIDDDIPF